MNNSPFRSLQEFEIEKNDGQHLILAAATVLDAGLGIKEIEDLEWTAEDWHGNDVSDQYTDYDIADMVYDKMEQEDQETEDCA